MSYEHVGTTRTDSVACPAVRCSSYPFATPLAVAHLSPGVPLLVRPFCHNQQRALELAQARAFRCSPLL